MKTSKDILETNKKQKEFYNTKKKNLATRLWSRLREKTLKGIRQNSGMQQQYYELHQVWFGDLSTKKVLDLGCYAGNTLSMHLAENAKSYLGLDLSDVAIEKLNKRLQHLPHAKALAADFLSDDFQETNFDLIYAYGVLHHFENTAVLIDRLQKKLAPNGNIVSYDPLETSLPIKIMRRLYRPFQSDAAWEWPFTRKTYKQFADAFHIEERRGILGKSKWVVLLNLLPLGAEKKKRIAQKWHKHDWKQSAVSDKSLFRCMHLTMKMRKR